MSYPEQIAEIVQGWRHEVSALDLSSLGVPDFVNLVLQRSEVLYDQPRGGRIIRAWSNGDAAPLQAIANDLGPEIALRAAAFVRQDFEEIRPVLAALGARNLVDIGAGYGLFDLFAARHLGLECTLVDIEQNGQRHFGYQSTGAAYADLSAAAALHRANGHDVAVLNPNHDDIATLGPCDLAVSFLSCGFHYPLTTYHAFFRDQVRLAIMVDLRAATMRPQLRDVANLGEPEVLASGNSRRRVLIRKEAA